MNLNASGIPLAWGANNRGQLGIGSLAYSNIPLIVHGLSDITAVAAGQAYSLALKRDGTVWAWGTDEDGELGAMVHTVCKTGYGRYPCSPVPIQVEGLNNVIAIAAGDSYGLALKKDGTVWTWGAVNGFGTSPVRLHHVRGIGGVTAIAAGGGINLALLRDGRVWAWGANDNGALGTGTNGATPAPVRNLQHVVMIAVGEQHSLALERDGTVWAWGFNDRSLLGTGTAADSAVPTRVHDAHNVVAIAAGTSHSLAVTRDGRVLAWGDNFEGELGASLTLVDSFTPRLVSGLAGIVAVAAGGADSLALKRDGTVWAWGADADGQLGVGPTPTYRFRGHCSPTPRLVRGLTNAVAIAAGNVHSLALRVTSSGQ